MKSIHALMLDDIINTTHANFENADIQAKFKLGLMLEESTPCHHLTYLD
jgi:hypothetical protein